jgi:hypothetical protein
VKTLTLSCRCLAPPLWCSATAWLVRLVDTRQLSTTTHAFLVYLTTAMSTIAYLPPELIENITASLEGSDYCAFRLTSRRLYSASHPQFKKRYFSTVSTHLSPDSPGRLVKLSSCQHLVDATETLVVVLEDANLKDASDDHDAFYLHGSENGPAPLVTNQLCVALRGLPNLKNVQFRADCNGGEDDRLFLRYQAWCFLAVLRAIVDSDIKLEGFSTRDGKPWHLKTLSRTEFNGQGCSTVHYNALSYYVPYVVGQSECFSKLTTLELCVTLSSRGGQVPHVEWQHGLFQFLSSAPLLESLALYLGVWPFTDHFYLSVRSSELFRPIAERLRLSRLRNFQLFGGEILWQDIRTFTLNHSTTLRKLALLDVCLSSSDVPSTPQNPSPQHGGWIFLLASFRDSLELSHFRLSRPFAWNGEGQGRVTNNLFRSPSDTYTGVTIDTTEITRHCTMADALDQVIDNFWICGDQEEW